MAKCPKCGAKLHWYDFRAECKHCGVNIPNYKWEERLENDADTAETSFAKLHYKMSNFKYGTIGSPLMIVRLVFTLLPLVALVVPLVKITLCFPFYEKTESVSFLTFILNYLTKYDIKASLSLMHGEALGGVVEDCVNKVGVDLNTASASLLEYISGVSKVIAKNIVSYREENGRFESRKELLKVAKLGPKAFEQCAGFMRITGGKNPLDGTSVHPESYEAVEKLFAKLNMKTEQISEGPTAFFIKDYKKMAEEIGVGEITLRDIIKELQKPGRDPRDEMPRPILRTDVLDMKDLKVGMILKGTVRNVIDFGAFVDIGVHQDGLVHISQMTKRFIKHPLEAVSVGDIVEVKVISLDLAKKRIGLSMLLDK